MTDDGMPSPLESSTAADAASSPVARLLVVEDDPDQQELIVETLEDHFGVGSTFVVGTCAEARCQPLADFDLVLCDINLPDGNGLDLLAEIGQACAIPVMMLTGQNDTGFAREAIRRGAVDYVVKADAYLVTMPLVVEKNLAAGTMARERETAARQLRDEATRLASDLAAAEKQRVAVEATLKQAEQEASTDPMTGCYNRRAFDRVFSQLFAEAYRTGGDLVCMMIDLDRFKEINDTLGHAIGDALIKAAARSIAANLRQMDVACRYGGDEFIMLLPSTTAGAASSVADRIRRDYGQASARLLDGVPRTMSIGIGSFKEAKIKPANAESFMVLTDRALYQAKESGRNQICAAG